MKSVVGSDGARLWVGGVEIPIKSMAFALLQYPEICDAAERAIKGLSDVVIQASWQYPIMSAEMKWHVEFYRRLMLAIAKREIVFRKQPIQREIIRQRRLDRRRVVGKRIYIASWDVNSGSWKNMW